jgi:hypothetical protein
MAAETRVMGRPLKDSGGLATLPQSPDPGEQHHGEHKAYTGAKCVEERLNKGVLLTMLAMVTPRTAQLVVITAGIRQGRYKGAAYTF